jgi:hypothetical protein
LKLTNLIWGTPALNHANAHLGPLPLTGSKLAKAFNMPRPSRPWPGKPLILPLRTIQDFSHHAIDARLAAFQMCDEQNLVARWLQPIGVVVDIGAIGRGSHHGPFQGRNVLEPFCSR